MSNAYIPLACNMNAMTPDERVSHEANFLALRARLATLEPLENGWAFHLPRESDLIVRAAQFITLERLCCPFLEFALTVPSAGETFTLALTGREGVREFLRAELGLP